MFRHIIKNNVVRRQVSLCVGNRQYFAKEVQKNDGKKEETPAPVVEQEPIESVVMKWI